MPIVPGKLRALREARDESREQVAVAIDRSCTAVCHYESGARNPSAVVLERIADHFGVSIDDLFDRDTAVA